MFCTFMFRSFHRLCSQWFLLILCLSQVLGPFTENNIFIEDDFKLLEDFDMDLYARNVRNKVLQYSIFMQVYYFIQNHVMKRVVVCHKRSLKNMYFTNAFNW